jgi:hypothetical protein
MRTGTVFEPHQPPRRAAFARAAVGVMLLAFLSGCASVIGELPAAVGGLPEGTPERSETPVAYPAVHDMPPQRGGTILTAAEQQKAAAELAAAREAQDKRAAAAARDQ